MHNHFLYYLKWKLFFQPLNRIKKKNTGWFEWKFN